MAEVIWEGSECVGRCVMGMAYLPRQGGAGG